MPLGNRIILHSKFSSRSAAYAACAMFLETFVALVYLSIFHKSSTEKWGYPQVIHF